MSLDPMSLLSMLQGGQQMNIDPEAHPQHDTSETVWFLQFRISFFIY